MSYVIPAPAVPSVEVKGSGNRFPVRRIFCVGRNYAAHAREMGSSPDATGEPVVFLKPDGAVLAPGPVRLPAGAGEIHHAGGRHGADTETVLAELGVRAAQLEQLRADGVV